MYFILKNVFRPRVLPTKNKLPLNFPSPPIPPQNNKTQRKIQTEKLRVVAKKFLPETPILSLI